MSTLYVDLDGTLISSDLLHEAAVLALREDPLVILRLPFWLLRGKAALKAELASRVTPAPQLLPYHDEVLAFLRCEQSSGRTIVLVTASPRPWAEAVSRHLGLFDRVIATENGRNLKGQTKLDAIRANETDPAAFDYVGDSWVDMPVWREASQVYAVGPSEDMKRWFKRMGKEAIILDAQRSLFRPALMALRPHHWTKNLLLFLPLLLAQAADAASLAAVGLGFVALSAVASAAYIINDLVDIEADRAHSKKCKRPFASGALPCKYGPILIVALLVVAVLAVSPLPPLFWAGLGGYLMLTTTYSFWLKRKVLVDVFMLAALYTLRIIAGGWVVGVPVSNWLLGLSIFMFTSLALAKRATELREAAFEARGQVKGRGYTREDLPLVEQMGITSAYCSVLVLALYISGDKVRQMYAYPDVLWLACPVLMYWLSRLWLRVHRGLLHHDPLVDAMKDPISLCCGLLILAIAFAAA